jgi:hypothetical protein
MHASLAHANRNRSTSAKGHIFIDPLDFRHDGAKVVGISASSVQRIWRAHGLQPHRVKQFKLSTDPRFVDKLRDIVGLYVDPPAHAVVLPLHAPSASWLNAVEGFFAKLTKRRLRRGTLLSVVGHQPLRYRT